MCTQHKVIQCDIEKIKQLLVNSIKYNQNKCIKNKDILVHISDTQLDYKFSLLQGEIKKIQALSFIITTEKKYTTQAIFYKMVKIVPIKILDKKEDQLIIQNREIVNFHYGYTEIIETRDDITQLYIIPINVHKVCQNIMHLLPTLSNKIPIINDWAVQQEKIFIQKIKNQLNFDSNKIIETIKIIKNTTDFNYENQENLFILIH